MNSGNGAHSNIQQSQIISCLSMSAAMKHAKELASGILCRAESGRPCGKCAACRKI